MAQEDHRLQPERFIGWRSGQRFQPAFKIQENLTGHIERSLQEPDQRAVDRQRRVRFKHGIG